MMTTIRNNKIHTNNFVIRPEAGLDFVMPKFADADRNEELKGYTYTYNGEQTRFRE